VSLRQRIFGFGSFAFLLLAGCSVQASRDGSSSSRADAAVADGPAVVDAGSSETDGATRGKDAGGLGQAKPTPRATPHTADASVPKNSATPQHNAPPSGDGDSAPGAVVVEAPVGPLSVLFDPPGRGFSGALDLTLSAGTADTTIHYTLDGSLPNDSSPSYSAPLHITTTSLVRAIAVSGQTASTVVNHSYISIADDATSFDSNLPVLVVHMLGKDAPATYDRDYVPATLAVFEPANGRTHLTSAATVTSRLGIKVRGRSTRAQAKPSYTIELRGVADDDAPFPLLGMPSDGDWVLYAPYTFDPSLIRNAVVYELSNRIGRYAPRTKFCELFLVADGDALKASDYVGVYSLTERLTRGDQRIAINKLKKTELTAPAVTGGYIIKIDEPDSPDEAFMAAGQTFIYVDPGSDDIAAQQTSYITEYLNSWQSAVSASDGQDPSNGNAYEALMDSSSFVDHHILNMLAKNPDAFVLSAYFYKDRNGPLHAGPVWDFDLGLGNNNDMWGTRSLDPSDWGPGTDADAFTRAPYGDLFKHPAFADAYWQRWDQLLASTLTAATFHEVISGYQTQLTEAEARNRVRWPDGAPRNNSYDDELDALESWLNQRVGWIQQHTGVVP
jgi:CotH kinase protein/Fn3 associated